MRTARYRRPDVLAKIPLDRHTVIEASAGTGKTYTLEHLLIEILLRTEATIDQILVVTFTEKATAEMRMRIRRKLEELIAWEKEVEAPEEACWVLDDRARAKLTDALLALDTAQISTIHAFCQRVVTEHAFANRRLFDQERVDGSRAFTEAFYEVLREGFARDDGLKVWLEAWLDCGLGLDRLESLLRTCHRERAEKLPVLDEQALVEAADALTLTGDDLPVIQKALEAVKCHGATRKALLGRLATLAETLSAWRSERSVPQLLVRLGGFDFDYAVTHLGRCRDVVPALFGALQALGGVAVPFVAAVQQRFLPLVERRLETRKQEHGLFDFDDMLTLVREVLVGEGGEDLVRILRERYRFGLIDEFQDTDEVQWDIFRRLFFESPDGHVLYLIGDPKQAIYRFRGADVHVYLEAREAVAARGTPPVRLEQNFRSTSPVIDAYNLVFDQQAPYFGGGIDYSDPVRCGDASRRMLDGSGNPVKPVQLLHVVGPGQQFSADQMREALLPRAAREIADLLGPRRLYLEENGKRRPIEARDVFVLTYSAAEGYRVGAALRELGVPFAFYKQEGLYQTDEARDVCDLLQAIARPDHGPTVRRAWITPFFAVPLESLEGMREVDADHPLRRWLIDWKALADRREYDRLFASILEGSGVIRREVFFRASERALTNYVHVFECLLEETSRSRMTLDELIRRLQAYVDGREDPPGENGNTQRLETEKDAVQIMTMHKSKGLEAPVVFVLGGFTSAPGNGDVNVCHVPSRPGERPRRMAVVGPLVEPYRTACGEDEAAERQRLLYVALTRAKGRLYLPYFGMGPGGTAPVPSEGSTRQPFRVGGCYLPVHERLSSLVAEDAPSFGELFEREEVPVGSRSQPVTEAERESSVAWTPSAEYLRDPDLTSHYDALRRRHAGFLVTSYSRMKGGGFHPVPEEEEGETAALEEWKPLVVDDDLPGGTATGSFLHDVLEALVVEGQPLAPLDEWRQQEAVRELLSLHARRHDVASRHLDRAAELVHAALTAPLTVGGERRLDGVLHADRLLAEMEFLYPIPEHTHPGLHEAGMIPNLRIGRGYVKGFVDLVFEHGGLAYFADWKSDRLPRWDTGTIHGHVRRNYELQARLYTLAMVKLLRIHDPAAYEERFGGLLYLFVRGMRAGGSGTEGVYFTRPSWEEVLRWENELRAEDPTLSLSARSAR